MTKEQAIETINMYRINNSFTMVLTQDEFVAGFIGRYKKVFKTEVDSADLVKVAELMIEFGKPLITDKK